jgi:8-oxo-dGTP pyrophosphatase MutT (NUDIX family)
MGDGLFDAWLGILRRSCSHGGMPHIHEKIDFTVAVFVVDRDKVLLVHHRRLGKWLPLGGHVELDEDPEQAAHREVMEESGLAVELLGERPPTTEPGTRALIAPRFLDIHRISDTHEHIGLIYLARPRSGSTRLAPEEHHAIRWCSRQDLDQLEPPLSGAVRWYCDAALKEAGTTQGLGGSLAEHEARDRADEPAGPVTPSPAG